MFVKVKNTNNCGICLEPCNTVYYCCGAPVHRNCDQEWINYVKDRSIKDTCYQKCGGCTLHHQSEK